MSEAEQAEWVLATRYGVPPAGGLTSSGYIEVISDAPESGDNPQEES